MSPICLVEEVAIVVHPEVCSTGTQYDGPFATNTSHRRSHKVARAAILKVADWLENTSGLDDYDEVIDAVAALRAEVEK